MNNHGIPVKCLNTGISYASCEEAGRCLGLDSSSIRHNVRNELKSVKGYVFVKDLEYPKKYKKKENKIKTTSIYISKRYLKYLKEHFLPYSKTIRYLISDYDYAISKGEYKNKIENIRTEELCVMPIGLSNADRQSLEQIINYYNESSMSKIIALLIEERIKEQYDEIQQQEN